ncbi:MAG: SCO family protein [Sphingobacteriia bacterium]|nr:SCO family protein [Sphingobacteriia bacterium]
MRYFFLLLATFLSVGCGTPAHFNATDLTGSSIGVDFSLKDTSGKQRRLSDFKGKVAIVFFGYTQCPDVCPTTLSVLQETLKLLGKDADRVQVLFITLDPERDTAALLAQYVPSFHPSFLGLSGSATETEAVAKAFKVFYKKQDGTLPGRYSIDHSTGSYLYDPAGRLRLYLKYGDSPQRIAEDINQLLAGK